MGLAGANLKSSSSEASRRIPGSPPQRTTKWDIDRAPLKGDTDIDMDVEVDVDIDRYSGCLKGGFKVSSGIVQWYRISYGTDFDSS